MKVLLFVILKVIEIGGVIFIPYFLGKVVNKCVFGDIDESKILTWFTGWLPVLCIVLLVVFSTLMFYAIPDWFKLNWNIVNQIIK